MDFSKIAKKTKNLLLYPKELIALLIDSKSIVSQLKMRGETWYFSEEGKKAYENAKTPAEKTKFFFDYLCAITKDYAIRPTEFETNTLYKTAYIMAHSLNNSSLPYADYPNVLDAEENPFVRFFETGGILAERERLIEEPGLVMMAIFKGEDIPSYVEANASPTKRPYTQLTLCEKDGSVSDTYKIERDILCVFSCDFYDSDLYMPLYTKDILWDAIEVLCEGEIYEG